MSTQPDSTPTAPAEAPDKGVVCDALVSEPPAPEDPETRVWKSYVWHKDRCFFVSTITRNYDTYAGTIRGDETIVWAYDWKKAERGEMLHQAGGVPDHQQICWCLIAEGLLPDEDDERTKRFCR
jgi:hypothetical protein